MRFKRENNKSAIIESIDQDMIERDQDMIERKKIGRASCRERV